LSLCISKMQAQTDDNIGSQQVNIVTDYKPVIADAFKLNDNPSVRDTTVKIPKMTYNVLNKQFRTSIILDTIKAAKMKAEAVEKLSYNYAKLGLGNYKMPYAEFFFGNLRSKQWQFGAHAKHLSAQFTPTNKGEAILSNNQIDGFGKYLVANQRISLNAGWQRNVNSVYGYNARLFSAFFDSLQLKNIYKAIDINAKVQSINTDSSLLNTTFLLDYYNYNLINNKQKYSNENHFNFVADVSKLNDNQLLGAQIKYQVYRIGNHLSNSNLDLQKPNTVSLFSLSPYVKANGSKWNAMLGATILQEINEKKTRFFPNIWFNYIIVPDALTAYTNVTGNAKVNSIRSLTTDNPFMNYTTTNVKNTVNSVDATVGVKGNFNSKISYHLSGNYSIINQMQLFAEQMVIYKYGNASGNLVDDISVTKLRSFMPSNSPHNYQYSAIYENAKYWNIKGNLSYNVNQKLNVTAEATYQNYKMDTSKYAYYKENLNISLMGNYQLNEKISINTKIFYVGKRNGLSIQNGFGSYTGTAYNLPETKIIYLLPAYVDANIGAEYKHTKKLSAFVSLNNLLNARIQRWQHHPTLGFWAMGGVTYSF